MRNKLATFLGVLVLAVAATAFAISRSFSGTINTPSVLTWVDGSENQITPLMLISSAGPSYVDPSTGYVWIISGVATSAPTAVGVTLEGGVYYTTADCTGSTYLFQGPGGFNALPNVVYTAGDVASYWLLGTAAAVTVHTFYFEGTCYSDTESTNIFNASGPLTPPTLPAGPWHIEAD